MASGIECPKCRSRGEAGARFCMNCGASMTPSVHCPACNQLQAAGSRFCTSCGSAMTGATYQGSLADGAVVEGVWQRGPDEFIRRVEPEDCRTFLGSRVVRIPAGTVGVVVVGGRVERLLPAGEQTAVPLFERIANFFTGRGANTAFYLLDLRPIPIPFAVQTRPSATGRSVQAQILVTFQIPRGDRDAVGVFLDSVLGARAGFSAGDLYNFLRPEVVRICGQVLEQLTGEGELRYAQAQADIRKELADNLGRRYGLIVDASVAPLTSTASLSFDLGTDTQLFTEDGTQVELDLVIRVQGQHEDFSPERLKPTLGSVAAARLRRLAMNALVSGEGFTSIEEALRTDVARELSSFGMQLVSINVIDVRSKTGVWLLGARAELTQAAEELGIRRAWLEQGAKEVDLLALTLTQTLHRQEVEREAKLATLRSELKTQRQEQGLRADDAFTRDQARLDDRKRRQDLGSANADLDISDAQVSARQKLGVTAAAREVAQAQRADRQADELDDLRHTATKQGAAFEARADLTRKERGLEGEKKVADLAFDSERTRKLSDDATYVAQQRNDVAFSDHERRTRLDDERSDREQQRQIDKLRAMAELDRQMAEQEQAHELKLRESLRGLSEREMIAMQASTLSKSEGGGAAWAQALAAAEAQKERDQRLADQMRHGSEIKDLLREQAQATQSVMAAQLDRMEAIAQRAMDSATDRSRDAGASAVYGRSLDAMSRVAASRAAPAPVVAGSEAAAASVPCRSCASPLRADARFCAACGSAQSA